MPEPISPNVDDIRKNIGAYIEDYCYDIMAILESCIRIAETANRSDNDINTLCMEKELIKEFLQKIQLSFD